MKKTRLHFCVDNLLIISDLAIILGYRDEKACNKWIKKANFTVKYGLCYVE